MRFKYYYKTSDNVRHEAEISAPSRDEAFAALRDRGIRPIKVVADEELRMENGKWRIENGKRRGVKLAVWIACASAMALVPVSFYIFHSTFSIHQVMTPQGPVTFTVAAPLPRQMIPGNRMRIEEAMVGRDAPIAPQGASPQAANVQDARSAGVFRFAAEAYLAQYAEPGRPPLISRRPRPSRLSQLPREARGAEFKACLKEPIRIASTDFTEVVDLKRIVAGMKHEMRAYLAGGGTVEQYLAELEKRQRLEISYRDNAERRLNELLEKADDGRAASRSPLRPLRGSRFALRQPDAYGAGAFRRPQSRTDGARNNADPDGAGRRPYQAAPPESAPYREAYSYWLKANAQLQAMGIYPLALPDALRTYQMGLELDE